MTLPEVTVVIPTRDRYALLSTAALPSALGQEAIDVEVIVVDDGSADRTTELLRELPEPRLRIIRHDRSQGVTVARNAGIAAARAPWIAFLDDDDLWSPRKLATQLAALRAANASFAYCSAVVLREDGAVTEVLDAPPADRVAAQLLRRNAIPAGSSNVIASTELLRRVGGFDEKVAYLEDWDLWIRLALEGRPVACQEALVGYVRHAQRRLLGGDAAFAALERLEEKYGSIGFRPDPARLLSWVAGEHRRAGRRSEAIRIYARTALAYRDPRQLARLAATVLDWRGAGFRQLLSRGRERGPICTRPGWLRSR